MHRIFRYIEIILCRNSSSVKTRFVSFWERMRDPEIIEAELLEISSIADDAVKLERIVAWCATHPDEVPFALHQLLGRRGGRESTAD
jgi:hypothetical protein